MFQIIALLSVRKEETDKLEALLKPLLEASRRDAGCLGYDCRADVLNPGTWLFFEKWQDDASLEKHMAAPHFKAFEQGVAPLLTAPLTIHKVMK